MPIQTSGDVPSASLKRNAMSTEMAARLFKTRDKAARGTPRWAATSVTDISPRKSRSTTPGWGGLNILERFSMIVMVVDQYGVGVFKGESEPPILINPDRPMSSQIAGEGVQFPPRAVHISWPPGRVQQRQLCAQPSRVFWLNARLRSRVEELLDTFVPEGFD